jgi:hypothetical protein
LRSVNHKVVTNDSRLMARCKLRNGVFAHSFGYELRLPLRAHTAPSCLRAASRAGLSFFNAMFGVDSPGLLLTGQTLRSERRHGNDRRTSRAARPEKSAARAGCNQVAIPFGNGDYDFSDQRARGRKSQQSHDLLPNSWANRSRGVESSRQIDPDQLETA